MPGELEGSGPLPSNGSEVAVAVAGVAAAAAAFSSFGRSATRHSVVSIRPATLAAFCSAVRTTFTGSMTPCARRLPYWSVAAL